MMQEYREYTDSYGHRAIAVGNAYNNGWKLTFLFGKYSYTMAFDNYAQMVRKRNATGSGWRETGRWLATTYPTA